MEKAGEEEGGRKNILENEPTTKANEKMQEGFEAEWLEKAEMNFGHEKMSRKMRNKVTD